MSDWTTARVVRDRAGHAIAVAGITAMHLTGPRAGIRIHADRLPEFGPLVPVLDTDGLPVVRTVGDLTARHIGRRVRVTVAGIETTGKLTGLFASDARPVSLHVDDVTAEVLWIVGPELGLTLDTPCELLPEGDA